MNNIEIIEILKSLLVEYTSKTETQIENNLTAIFQSFENKSLKEDIAGSNPCSWSWHPPAVRWPSCVRNERFQVNWSL